MAVALPAFLLGAVWLILGVITAAGGLRSWTRFRILFPFGWFITTGIPGGTAFVLMAIYSVWRFRLVGWLGLALMALSCVAALVTPRPFDESWARGLPRRR